MLSHPLTLQLMKTKFPFMFKREKYKSNKISINHFERLKEVGFVWESTSKHREIVEDSPESKSTDDSGPEVSNAKQKIPESLTAFPSLNKQQKEYIILWDKRYSDLAEYKRRYGTCNVSKLHDKVLFSWVLKVMLQ